ncbi:MAG TPA: ABC-2 transporter permease [Rhodanobacteraceae bacterium]|nr:ABC-2 transporter permease [Rhodanobacteraceae bacterium]
MKNFLWLVRREYWENRGGFLWAPVITGIVILALTLMGIITAEVFRSRAGVHINGIDFSALSANMSAEQLNGLAKMLDASLLIPGSVIGVVMFVVLFFYCIHSLWDDRRDRSILFWKSLPISDLSTVLSKAVSALVLVPIIAIIVSVLAGWLSLLMLAIAGSFHDLNLWSMLWTLPHPLRLAWTLVCLLPLYLLWALPSVGWLMLCSAAARGKPMRWAIALPIGIGVLLGWFNIMGTVGLSVTWYWHHIALRALFSLLPGSWVFGSEHGWSMVDAGGDGVRLHAPQGLLGGDSSLLDISNSYATLGTPAMLIGIAVGVALLAAAVWVRRRRSEL